MKKKSLIIIILLIVGVLFITTPNVMAANEWASPGAKVACGNIGNVPAKIPVITNALMNTVMVIIPVLLVIFGSIDLAKSVMSQKEDDIKAGQKTLIKRIITGLCVFLVVAVVKVLVGVIDDGTGKSSNIISCINCFVNNECEAAVTADPE